MLSNCLEEKKTTEDALRYFGDMRFGGQGVTVASQKRYVKVRTKTLFSSLDNVFPIFD